MTILRSTANLKEVYAQPIKTFARAVTDRSRQVHALVSCQASAVLPRFFPNNGPNRPRGSVNNLERRFEHLGFGDAMFTNGEGLFPGIAFRWAKLKVRTRTASQVKDKHFT